METLEVSNPSLFLRDFNRIPRSVRIIPSRIMILVTSKFVIGFVLSIFAFIAVMLSSWEFLTYNKFHHSISAKELTEMSLERNKNINAHIVNTIYSNYAEK